LDAITLGIICGLVFGIVAVLIMIPMSFESRRKKWEALSAAFVERFMIGFLIPNVSLGMNPLFTGLILGIFLSLPSAIITRAYAPIIGFGIVGGLIIGYISGVVL